MQKPNIVVYLSDDHGWEYLGCYGNTHIQTPHLDRLAGEGLDEKSFKAVLHGQQTTFHDKIYGTHTRDGNMNVFPQRCVRDNRYKYILNLMPENIWTTHFTEVEDIPESHAAVWHSWVEKAKSDPKTA